MTDAHHVTHTPAADLWTYTDHDDTLTVMGPDPTADETECIYCGRTDTDYLGLSDMLPDPGNDYDGTGYILSVTALCPDHVDEYAAEGAWKRGIVPLVVRL